ncbi:MAG: formimidoylglutamate deiminase [Actinobacteria bacterium]|nr:formimidoylglutamate deiminase [Actinomycetota bacterium]MBI3687610.1 formimidoylglutamate deiminase [Actinomycetota bacterium]
MTRYWCERALVGDEVLASVLVETAGGRITAVRAAQDRPPDAEQLAGLTLPGLANAHSHAFHRVLRGRTQAERGTFWSWRERMYAVAQRLDPDTYHALARSVYGEMALAGITCVGEFHYLHHGPGGQPYRDPNAMGEALLAAAAEAGIRITLLDACYLTGDVDQQLGGAQLRFGDGTVERWGMRVSALRPGPHARVGAAIHSVRAVPPPAVDGVLAWASPLDAPVHLHLSEQPAENEACQQRYGLTPTRLLAERGALGPRTTAVHATHLTASDIAAVGGSGTTVCLCPTTERDLADGIGPVPELVAAGAPLALGTDSHAVIDMFEEARAVELDQRLRSGRRGHLDGPALLRAATAAGHASLGWPEAGVLAVGAPADLVTVRLDSPRTAGIDPDQLVFAAAAADVVRVIVDGRDVVVDGRHQRLGDVGAALARDIAGLMTEPAGAR